MVAADSYSDLVTQLSDDKFLSSTEFDANYAVSLIKDNDGSKYFKTSVADTNQWLRIDFIWARGIRGVYIAT